MSAQLAMRFDSIPWIQCRDANPTARALFVRHYSYRPYADGRKVLKFVGPGEYMVLLTPDAKALFVWRKFISKDGQQGVNCAVFRNEGAELSSDLIREASRLGMARWPRQRFYTYVNPRKLSVRKRRGLEYCPWPPGIRISKRSCAGRKTKEAIGRKARCQTSLRLAILIRATPSLREQ